ncbi:unnamed protein product [Rotaria sp. Silwood2]|nr:unnamed protein product [Rotaria sp. Silwood2]CAF3106701.1 unnamed protein product [Rotaria sp. Silwood2]CAF4352693.1 unnamed protein product [Rotaria sp. Silwood2]CAF4432474.1 unnamed protein product [Rotaria sp. Silwood2]CAF4760025.1 unnamed protein product [Rotaria sp. Silwood2]
MMKNGQDNNDDDIKTSMSEENKLRQQETNGNPLKSEATTMNYNNRAFIRHNIPCFSHRGILQYYRTADVLLNPPLYLHIINRLKTVIENNSSSIECLASNASRGHLYEPTVAALLQLPLICIQKANGLPGPTLQKDYSMVYSKSERLEIAYDETIKQSIDGKYVALIDDCIAAGWSILAAAQLIEQAGGIVAGCFAPFNDTRHGRLELFQEKLQMMTTTFYVLNEE